LFIFLYYFIKETNELIYEDVLNTSSKNNDNASTTASKSQTKIDEPIKITNNKEIHSPTNKSGNSLSNILHIRYLTRPFTLSQLKELLSKYGPLLANPNSSTSEKHYFWINSVKSHCFVAFENEEGAKAARDALDNSTWPQSNPKQLKVSFLINFFILKMFILFSSKHYDF
jgi:apoptotic chromatin condensation inducer in the nucleus